MRDMLNWVEIDRAALAANLRSFRGLVGPAVTLMPVVKSNAYGHGLDEVAPLLAAADRALWFGVNSLDEGLRLRALGIRRPVLLLGHVPLSRLAEAAAADLRLTVYNPETVRALSKMKTAGTVRLHLKLETGTNRQGVDLADALKIAALIRKAPRLELEGCSTHFANIEDTTSPVYPRAQLARYQRILDALRAKGHDPKVNHVACTAAALVFPETRRQLVRLGIGLYGLWPSRETMLSLAERGRKFSLAPALSWKTRVVQVKAVPAGSYVGYGCTYRTTRRTKLAVLPVGYNEGYDRKLSNTAHVLVRGKRAPIRGRV
ncbi:MAG: alanine racemase, partial [Candidatus Edwardsbacteria bacterium]|nr:alanine racemase [Candidatus Edwardsbacteria bacterium]